MKKPKQNKKKHFQKLIINMTTQKPPPQFHYKGTHFVEKHLSGSIKLSCATDPISPQNKIRPQMSTIQYVTPNNLLSRDITVPICGHKK